MHPSPPRHCADSRAATRRDRPVERSEQAAAATLRWLVRADQAEQGGFGKRRRLLHDPAFSAHRDAIAGSKGHACVNGNAHTVEKLPVVSAF